MAVDESIATAMHGRTVSAPTPWFGAHSDQPFEPRFEASEYPIAMLGAGTAWTRN